MTDAEIYAIMERVEEILRSVKEDGNVTIRIEKEKRMLPKIEYEVVEKLIPWNKTGER